MTMNSQQLKMLGYSKSSAMKEVYSNRSLPQETRGTSNKQPKFTPKATRKRSTKQNKTKQKVEGKKSRRSEQK